MRKPPHVPEHYSSRSVGNLVFWGIDGSDSVAAALAPTCLDGIEQLLQFHLQRTVHVVVYATNADARAALDRDVAPTMLLAPYHAKGESLLALQAPSVDDMNGDERRMRRHICHELAHTFAAERTGSLKRLGDGNRGMRIASWVDEDSQWSWDRASQTNLASPKPYCGMPTRRVSRTAGRGRQAPPS